MSGIVRLVHRVFNVHRLEGCTLRDVAGDLWRGQACRCGYVDDTAWEWVGSAVDPIRPGAYEQWTTHTQRTAV